MSETPSPEDLAEALSMVLKAHREWLESNGARGKQLDLSNEDLTGGAFRNTRFTGGNLEEASFEMANMKKTKHHGGDYHDAEFDDLTGAKFKKSESRFRKTLSPAGGVGRIMK